MKKKALITGITGQDGSYLAELLGQRFCWIYPSANSETRCGNFNWAVRFRAKKFITLCNERSAIKICAIKTLSFRHWFKN